MSSRRVLDVTAATADQTTATQALPTKNSILARLNVTDIPGSAPSLTLSLLAVMADGSEVEVSEALAGGPVTTVTAVLQGSSRV